MTIIDSQHDFAALTPTHLHVALYYEEETTPSLFPFPMLQENRKSKDDPVESHREELLTSHALDRPHGGSPRWGEPINRELQGEMNE